MMDKFGKVKIIDFGISRMNKVNKTSDTQILGTQGYAAPEQYGFSQTSCKSDIYSLGVLINFIITGALPSQIKADGLLGEIAEKCTRIDENQRFGSVDEIMKALETGKTDSKKKSYALPGFRTGTPWRMIIASLYYIAVFFIFCGYAFIEPTDVFFALFDIFLLFVPVLIFCNYLGWADNLNASKKRSSRFVCTLFGIIYEIVTFLIFIIIYKPK